MKLLTSTNRVNNFPDRCELGALETVVVKINKVVRKTAILDNTSVNDFVSFDDFKIPNDKSILFGSLSGFANMKDAVSFGYADSLSGTNFIELMPAKSFIITKDSPVTLRFLYTIPIDKFPLVQIKFNLMTGRVTMDGIEFTFAELPINTASEIGFEF